MSRTLTLFTCIIAHLFTLNKCDACASGASYYRHDCVQLLNT